MSGLDGLLERLFARPAPEDVRRKARLLVLDTLGCALAAAGEPKVRELRSLLGKANRAVALAVAACWHEACEGLARAHGRPGVPVIAACIDLGLRRDVRLDAFLDAVIAGYETGGRMGELLRMRPGMHVDASWPALGVAAAATRILGASAATASASIEIAAAQIPFSLYLPVEQGADSRNTYLGHAAWLGIYAAQAALAGCDAPHGAIERFAELALGRAALPLPLPDEYVMREAYLKPFAAVRHVHYGAEAAIRLRAQIPDTGTISGISLSIYPEAVTYCGNRAPRTPIQAQFSLSFGIAAALRYGRLDAEQYAASSLNDPELRRLESLVRVDANPAERGRAATLRVQLGKQTLETRVASVKGDPDSPMSEEQCREKFMRFAGARAAGVANALLRGPETQMLRSILQEVMRP